LAHMALTPVFGDVSILARYGYYAAPRPPTTPLTHPTYHHITYFKCDRHYSGAYPPSSR
jgi:hypothetical protein